MYFYGLRPFKWPRNQVTWIILRKCSLLNKGTNINVFLPIKRIYHHIQAWLFIFFNRIPNVSENIRESDGKGLFLASIYGLKPSKPWTRQNNKIHRPHLSPEQAASPKFLWLNATRSFISNKVQPFRVFHWLMLGYLHFPFICLNLRHLKNTLKEVSPYTAGVKWLFLPRVPLNPSYLHSTAL